MEERSLIDLRDVINQTAGASGTGASFRLRGIDSGPIGTLRSELASFYVDGVALSGWVKSDGPQQMWDVQQAEILRGPQSTNLGRNSLAGAIVITTQPPLYENSFKLRAGMGNYDTQELSGAANVSLAAGISALRFSFDASESDDFSKNITRNEDDYAYVERQSARLKWLLEPSGDLRMVFSLQYVDNDSGDTAQAIEGAGYDRDRRISLADVRAKYPLTAWLGSLTADYSIRDSWSIKSITAGMDGERARRDDFDDSAADEGVVYREGDDRNFSQELRVDYQSAKSQGGGSTGIYYSDVEAKNRNDTIAVLNLAGFGLQALIDLGVYPAQYDLTTGGASSLSATSYAIFSEWEIDFRERWRLSIGARYDREEQKVEFQNTGSSTVILPDPADWPGLEAVIGTVNGQLEPLSEGGAKFTPETDFDAFLPHIGITCSWNDDVSSSFFIKRGYRSGGTEVTGLNNINRYDPEYLTNYELATRMIIFDGAGVFNANLYFGDWQNQQVDVAEIPGSVTFFRIENAGESEIYGIELDFNYRVSDALTVFATAAYSETGYVDLISTTGDDFSGNRFAFAPETSGVIGANYRLNSGWYVNANATYQGGSYADSENATKFNGTYISL